MFSDLTKTLPLFFFFGRHCLKFFQTSWDYNLAQVLAVHIRFDDLDPMSKSQVCQNHKMQNIFRFLFTVV